ncbi:MAG: hypothetical protein NC120_08230 [Ruminococcus sp.]|nr:hypothetical protein [Ruminococcus sp.]
MLLDDYDPDDPENSRIITFADEINTHRCNEAGISFQLGNIDFSSDKDDIIKFLGGGKSEKFIKGEKIRYSFYDELYKLNITLFISNETDTVSAIIYNLIARKSEEKIWAH